MPRRLVLLFVVALALLGSGALASLASAARFYTPDYGSKTPEEIGGFDLGADGSLTPIPGSPFPAEEPGLGGLWSLAFTPDGSRAISGLYFTGGVQAYRVPPSGIFELAGATLTASATSVAISPDGRFAFVSTREFMGKPAEGIRRFAVGADGALTPLGSTGTDEFADIAITPDGRFLFASGSNLIARFAIGADGSLTPLGTTPAPGARFLSTAGDGQFLTVLAETSETAVASFAIGGGGELAQVGTPAGLGVTSTKIFVAAPDGRHAYVPSYNDDVIATVAIAADGTPSVGGEMAVVNPESVAVSPDGRFLVFYRGGGSDNALGVAAIAADGSLSKLPFETPWNTGEPERLVFQPQPAPVASLAIAPAAAGLPATFDARGSARAARYDWNFGDGTVLANGGPTPSHVYASPGRYAVTLTVSDASGCSTRQVYNGQTTLCPGGPAPTAAGTVETLPARKARPVLGRIKAAPRRFAPKTKGAKGKGGTHFRYTVSAAATVRFKFERKTIGRLAGGECRPRTRANAKGKKCPRFKLLGSRPQAAKAGANSLAWNGRLKGKPLPPGSYRATAVATDAAGGRSAPQTVGFRILPLPKEP